MLAPGGSLRSVIVARLKSPILRPLSVLAKGKSGCCCGRCTSCTQSRFMSTQAPKKKGSESADSNLLRTVEKELKCESDDSEFGSSVLSGRVPEDLSEMLEEIGFKLSTGVGSSVVTLSKETDREAVRVQFNIEQLYGNEEDGVENFDAEAEPEAPASQRSSANPAAEEEFDEDGSISYNLNVQITRRDNGETMSADVLLHPDYLEVCSMQMRAKGSSDPQPLVSYSGPDLLSLDEAVQEHLASFVASRGINDQMHEFIASYSDFKESAEYCNWLNSLKRFLTK